MDSLSASPDQKTGSTTTTTAYYYLLNLQGDVLRLVDASGVAVAGNDYDPYGNILSASGTLATTNPLRYRGYYYDAETGFYYLQSRYYDPAIGRFINADSYASTGQSFLGYNMFAYCNNNPSLAVDYSGKSCVAGFRPDAGYIPVIGITAVYVLTGLCIVSAQHNASTEQTKYNTHFTQDTSALSNGLVDGKELSDTASQYGLGKCKEAAESLYYQDGGNGAIVRLSFPGGSFVVADDSRFGGEAISSNGVHYGYKDKSDIVRCNVYPFGLPFDVWVNRFHDYTTLPPIVLIIPFS